MSDKFERYMMSKAELTKEELTFMHSRSISKKVRRKQLLLQEGEVCRCKIFVVKGLLRTYRLQDDGTEHIMRFTPENTWTLDAESYYNQTPARYTIEALEASEVILWTRENVHELFAAIPAIRSFSEQMVAKSLYTTQERVLMNISYTSEQKYQHFIRSFPEVFNRVPLHMVASYLGVSRETLSRIRHSQLKPARE